MSQVTVDIHGYRQLNIAEQDEINIVKEHAAEIGELVASYDGAPDVDQHWLAIAKTHLQQGFMALVRSIAKPGGF